jgi:hypothetical protein
MLHSVQFQTSQPTTEVNPMKSTESITFRTHLLATSLLVGGLLLAPALQAKTFKWASAGEISTWDIHSQNNALQNGLHAAVYESLVYYNSRTFKVEPMLATSWSLVTPSQMRMNLRKGVKFHDGSDFTADDAVFSLSRAMSKTSNFTPYVTGFDRIVKVDAHTIAVRVHRPERVLRRSAAGFGKGAKFLQCDGPVSPFDRIEPRPQVLSCRADSPERKHDRHDGDLQVRHPESPGGGYEIRRIEATR